MLYETAMHEIEITVAGGPKVGVTTVGKLIRDALVGAGFKTEFVNLYGDSVGELDYRKVQSTRKKTRVVIKEKMFSRAEMTKRFCDVTE